VSVSDRRERLIALRDLLAESLREVDPEKRAPLAGQYRATLTEIDALAGAKEADPVDEIAQRRAARRAGTA
jgi:hypothetical protein